MNIIKNKLLGIITVLGLMTLTACGLYYPDSESSDNISFESNISDESKDLINNEIKNTIMGNYHISLPAEHANEALEITKLDIPEQIEGHNVSLNGLFDDNTFIVSLYDDSENSVNGIERGNGLYNFETKEYTQLPGFPNEGYEAFNRDYFVYKKYNSDFTSGVEDNSVRLYLYDINAKQEKLIYTYSFDRGVEFYGGHWKNNIVLSDNTIYFDDFVNEAEPGEDNEPDWHTYLYSYDIPSGMAEKILDNAQNPIAFKDTLLYIKQTDEEYDTMASLNNKYEFKLIHPQYFALTDDAIFSLDIISNDDEERKTTWGIKNMLTDEYILTTTNTISDLIAGDVFMAFYDFSLFTPVVYNAKDNSFIVFDDFVGKNVSWYVHNDMGIIRIIDEPSEMYLFRLK